MKEPISSNLVRIEAHFADGQSLVLADYSDFGAGYVLYHGVAKGQRRASMQSWTYRNAHDGIAGFAAKSQRLARGESIT